MKLDLGAGANYLRVLVNKAFENKEPWQIAALSTTSTLLLVWLYEFFYQGDDGPQESVKKYVFRLMRKIPAVRNKINKELSTVKKSFAKDIEKRYNGLPFRTVLPPVGKSKGEILAEMKAYMKLGDCNWEDGFVSGAVYVNDSELVSLVTEVYGATSYTNPLHPDVFPGINKMEAEIVRISCNLFHGSEDSCGTMTTGGTESILMACKAYRDYARDVRNIKRPEMIVPVTAHAAFDKAAHYLGMKIKHIPVNKDTSVNVKAMKWAISSRTCMLVGSVPNFPYGTMDNIESIAEIGRKYNIPVHVDACLGGFITVFMEKAGYHIPPFDFRVEGVTSISADTHKYGYTPKGSSVVLYSKSEFRRYQYTVTTDWPGGVYGSPTVSGSRAGGIISTCWATFMYYGLEGYVEATKKILKVAKFIEKGLQAIDGVDVLGKPITSVVAIGSESFDIYRLQEFLEEKGWHLNTLQFPKSIHLCITQVHIEKGAADRFLKDVRDGVTEIKKDPSKKLDDKMAMYGTAQTVSDRSIVGDLARLWLDSLYHTAAS